MSTGDTFSGTSHFDDCLNQKDSPATVIVSQAEGNAFRGRLVSRRDGQIRSVTVQGFVYVPGRQLIITRPGGGRRALGLVCTMSRNNDNQIDCSIMMDGLSKSCGTLGLRRDRNSQYHIH